jgi:hypothetical protein
MLGLLLQDSKRVSTGMLKDLDKITTEKNNESLKNLLGSLIKVSDEAENRKSASYVFKQIDMYLKGSEME